MLIERLRKEIGGCGKRRSVIARATGINEAALSRIVHGGSCKAETVDILLRYFGLTIVRKQKQKKKGGAKR
jgi:plasmid maintenance system antidote protein VapI